MINICLTGTPTTEMGILTGLLLNHPDVKLHTVVAQGCEGRRLDDTFGGLKGDTDIIIADAPDFDNTDLIFVDRPTDVPDTVKVVGYHPRCLNDASLTYGLPEMGRRRIVEGCTRAAVPSPEASATLLALLPLGKSLMLNNVIGIELRTPNDVDIAALTDEIGQALALVQNSFAAPISITVQPSPTPRACSAKVTIDNNTDIHLIRDIYEKAYANHHFTFTVDHAPQPSEVEYTNKCLLNLERHDTQLTVTAALDPKLKGAAGGAIHLMNLLFGFYECVGLELKGSGQPIP